MVFRYLMLLSVTSAICNLSSSYYDLHVWGNTTSVGSGSKPCSSADVHRLTAVQQQCPQGSQLSMSL